MANLYNPQIIGAQPQVSMVDLLSNIGQNANQGGQVGQQPIVPPGALPGTGGSTPLAMNIGTLGTAFSGMQALAGLYGAFQGQKLARKQFDYTKDVTDTNLANQIKSYNTALSDRINSRAAYQGLSQDQVREYMDRNSMTRS